MTGTAWGGFLGYERLRGPRWLRLRNTFPRSGNKWIRDERTAVQSLPPRVLPSVRGHAHSQAHVPGSFTQQVCWHSAGDTSIAAAPGHRAQRTGHLAQPSWCDEGPSEGSPQAGMAAVAWGNGAQGPESGEGGELGKPHCG